MQVSQNLMKVLDVEIKESLDEGTDTCIQNVWVACCRVSLHGSNRCMELYLSSADSPQCLLVQMSSKLGCHVLAAVTMLQSTGCAKELCNNSTKGVVLNAISYSPKHNP